MNELDVFSYSNGGIYEIIQTVFILSIIVFLYWLYKLSTEDLDND